MTPTIRRTLRPLVVALAALTLAACSSTVDDAGATGPGAGAGGAGTLAPGALDPTSIEYFQLEVGDRVYFATDSSALDAEAQATLRRQALWMVQNPAATAVVEGHADERGTREYNLALGARRAEAASSFLIAEGVAPGRIRSVTYGKERPESLCSNESCWSLNRRSVTVTAFGPTS